MAIGDVGRLGKLMPPPAASVEAPNPADWPRVEGRLGMVLPADYKAYIGRYGSGVVDGFLWVLNPFSLNENIRFPDSSDRQLAILRRIRDEGSERLPYPIHPEPGGLLLWAESANGDCLYWLTDGPPDAWRVTVNESRAPNWYDHPGPMSALLADLLDGTVDVEFFPNNFPLPSHTFRPF
jgi:hypothetical protein